MFFVYRGRRTREGKAPRQNLTLTPAITSRRTLYGWSHPRRL
nr:MAG TPA: hypothetical protein [Caudoviricetes sp.]